MTDARDTTGCECQFENGQPVFWCDFHARLRDEIERLRAEMERGSKPACS